jgi:hypothetical protein
VWRASISPANTFHVPRLADTLLVSMNLDPDQGLSPRSAATLLAVVACLGIGLFLLAASIDRKSSDPLYDPIYREMHTSSQLQVTPDLWKRKGESAADTGAPQALPAAVPPAPATPAIPIKIKRDSDQPPQQQPDKPQPPPSTGPS